MSFIKRTYIFLAVIAILSGGIIYTLFRTSEPLFFRWLSIAGFEHWLAAIRQHSLTHTPHLSEWMASIPVLILGYEVFQYAGILPGTFCFQDIILGSLGLLTGIMAGLLIDKANNHEKNFIQ